MAEFVKKKMQAELNEGLVKIIAAYESVLASGFKELSRTCAEKEKFVCDSFAAEINVLT